MEEFIKGIKTGYKVLDKEEGDILQIKNINNQILKISNLFDISLLYLNTYIKTQDLVFKHLALSIQLYCKEQLTTLFILRKSVVSFLSNIEDEIDVEDLKDEGVDLLLLLKGGVRIKKNKKLNKKGIPARIWRFILFIFSMWAITSSVRGVGAAPTPAGPAANLQLYGSLPTNRPPRHDVVVAEMRYGYPESDWRNETASEADICEGYTWGQVWGQIDNPDDAVFTMQDMNTVENITRYPNPIYQPPAPIGQTRTLVDIPPRIQDPRERQYGLKRVRICPRTTTTPTPRPRPELLDLNWIENIVGSFGFVNAGGVLSRNLHPMLINDFNQDMEEIVASVGDHLRNLGQTAIERHVFEPLATERINQAVVNNNILRSINFLQELPIPRLEQRGNSVILLQTGIHNYQEIMLNYTTLTTNLLQERMANLRERTASVESITLYEEALFRQVNQLQNLVTNIYSETQALGNVLLQNPDITTQRDMVNFIKNLQREENKLLSTVKTEIKKLELNTETVAASILAEKNKELQLKSRNLELEAKRIQLDTIKFKLTQLTNDLWVKDKLEYLRITTNVVTEVGVMIPTAVGQKAYELAKEGLSTIIMDIMDGIYNHPLNAVIFLTLFSAFMSMFIGQERAVRLVGTAIVAPIYIIIETGVQVARGYRRIRAEFVSIQNNVPNYVSTIEIQQAQPPPALQPALLPPAAQQQQTLQITNVGGKSIKQRKKTNKRQSHHKRTYKSNRRTKCCRKNKSIKKLI